MTDEERDEVRDILQMYDDLQYAYQNLPDKSGIAEKDLHFIGFDSHIDKDREYDNHADLLYNSNPGNYRALKAFGEVPNAHFPESHGAIIHMYRWILEVWRPLRGTDLNKEQVQKVLAAQINPDHR